MGHMLDFTRGRAAFFGRKPAWHAFGIIKNRRVTPQEALEDSATDFDTETVPTFFRTVRPIIVDGKEVDTIESYEEVPAHRFTRRTDVAGAKSVLGVVGPRYTPLQNRDAFKIVAPLVDNGVAEIVSAGALRGGRDVFLTLQFDIPSEIVKEVYGEKGRETVPMGCLTNNHAGQRLVRLFDNDFVIVCANTMRAAHATFDEKMREGRAFQVKHTLSVEANTTKAAEALWGNIIQRYENIARQYKALRATFLTTAQFRSAVLDTAFPIPRKLEKRKLTPREETSRRKLTTKRDALSALFEGKGRGVTGDHSAWEAYMALTEAVDHHPDVFKVRGDAKTRAAAVLDGRLATIKTNVIDALMDIATEQLTGK